MKSSPFVVNQARIQIVLGEFSLVITVPLAFSSLHEFTLGPNSGIFLV